jgi:hypothetical protein
MKTIKRIFIGLLAIIVILLVAALFMPKESHLVESLTINAPGDSVFNYIKQIKNQEKYSVWILADPNIKINYEGVDGTVGFKSSWKSEDDGIGENMGEGSQTIVEVGNGKVVADLNFIAPMAGKAKASTEAKVADDNQTTVTMTFDGHSAYPFNLMKFIGDGFIRDAQKKNLENLKGILEKK